MWIFHLIHNQMTTNEKRILHFPAIACIVYRYPSSFLHRLKSESRKTCTKNGNQFTYPKLNWRDNYYLWFMTNIADYYYYYYFQTADRYDGWRMTLAGMERILSHDNFSFYLWMNIYYIQCDSDIMMVWEWDTFFRFPNVSENIQI